MWLFKKHKHNVCRKDLVTMAKVYSECSTIEEFWVKADLMHLTPVSRWRWTNPFAVHYAMKNKAVRCLQYIGIPVVVTVLWLTAMLLPAKYNAIPLLILLVQLMLVSMQIFMWNKEDVAYEALCMASFEEIEAEMSKLSAMQV